MKGRSRVIRGIWAACLFIAGLNHARILFQHGLSWDYGGVGWPSAAYWSSLTLIDPVVAVALLIRPRIGVPAAAAVIATNVVHNLAITFVRVPAGAFLDHVASSFALLCQVGFLILVAATWRLANADLRAGELQPMR